MTKMKKIVFALAVALMAMACNQDAVGPLYTGADGLGNDGFAFASSVLNLETGREDRNLVRVPIYRGKTEANIVNLVLDFEDKVARDTVINGVEQTVMVDGWVEKDPKGIFSLATQRVVFSDGANVAYAVISYPNIEELSFTEKYKMRLSIKDGASPSKRDKTVITLNRRLTFNYIGESVYVDSCLFEKSYRTKTYRAQEAEVYRFEDPYSKGLLDEGYAEAGLMGSPSKYVQITVNDDRSITFERFNTGMLVPANYGGKVQDHLVYGIHPAEYVKLDPTTADFFDGYIEMNRKVGDRTLEMYPIYCMPTLYYGYLSFGAFVGAFPLTVTLPE